MMYNVHTLLVYIHQIIHQTMKLNNGKKPSPVRTCHLKTITPHFITHRLYCDVDHCVLLHFKENSA